MFVAFVSISGLATAQPSPKNTNEIKTLTVEQAAALRNYKGVLILDGLTAVSNDAAKVLSQPYGHLYLSPALKGMQ